MALARIPSLRRLLRSLIRHSDDEFFGTIEIKMVRGVPEMVRVIQQYKDGEMPTVSEGRLSELLQGASEPSVPPAPPESGESSQKFEPTMDRLMARWG